MDSSGEKRTATPQMNPLLLYPVIKCVFQNLPLDDLKQCRAVCHEWNSASIPILKKQTKVKLDSAERMKNFLQFYKGYDTQAFPFIAFRMSIRHADWNTEEHDQLIDLFNALRENIITLVVSGDVLYLNPLIELATNLVNLRLYCSSPNTTVELDKLAKVKHISIYSCCVSLDSFKNRIAPLSICLYNVYFKKNENKLEEILINDYIDFSKCSEIKIKPSRGFVLIFDMTRDIVSARKVYFNQLRVINWRATPANVDKRLLFFKKQTGMGIKELNSNRSELNLSALPKSLEKLSLDTKPYGINNWVPVVLPNLKCLIFRQSFEDSTAEIPAAYDMDIITSMFQHCPKIVDMELCGWYSDSCHCDINVDLLPVSLKRIKLSLNKNFNFVGDTVIHVDGLILDPGTFADAQKFMNKIKPKIVVVQLQREEAEDPSNEIISFVEESRNLEKIVLVIPVGCMERVRRSYHRALSTYLDEDGRGQRSNCYAFTNEVGKCLTKEEFKMYWF